MKPINKQINFFDLDGVLWETNSQVWVIDKENSTDPIIRLTRPEINNILSGMYFKEELKIEYNGDEYFISEEIFNRINRKKRLTIERIGLSWIEFYDKKYINNTKTTYLLKNVAHVENDAIVCILTGRAYQNRHGEILNGLRKVLLDAGISLFKIYFVSKVFQKKHTSEISLNKAHVLLEHMLGIKIEDGKFVAKKQDWYSEIYFYDDEKMNIDYANDMQTIFERVMKKTDDELFLTILDRIKNNQIVLINNLVTNNDVNNFKSTKVVLTEPVKFPIK